MWSMYCNDFSIKFAFIFAILRSDWKKSMHHRSHDGSCLHNEKETKRNKIACEITFSQNKNKKDFFIDLIVLRRGWVRVR